MDALKLTALRDFAIGHFPRAQRVSTGLPPHQYQRALYGSTALVSPNAPAIELAAARLLQSVMSLLIDWGDEVDYPADARALTTRRMVLEAQDLCTLTGTEIDWLPRAGELGALEVEPELEVEQSPPPSPVPPTLILQPGPTQTTAVAARYLGVAEQTMRSWASNDDGPLRPIKKGPFNAWPTDELIRLSRVGWTGRRKARKK